MLNTYKQITNTDWLNKQEALITSLKSQQLIIVLRTQSQDFGPDYKNAPLFSQLIKLDIAGVRNIEIAWSPHKKWIELIKKLQKDFPNIFLGAASVTEPIALEAVLKAELAYAMSPVWDDSLQNKARELNQVLIPGVFSPSEIKKAISFGHRVIKIFPASTLGINFLEQIRVPINPLPFVIAAGGISPNEINSWLEGGYDAVALGRGVQRGQEIDPFLKIWLMKS